MGVLTRPGGDAVRVERRDQPEVGVRVRPAERVDDRDARRLVPVDRSDDEDARAGARNMDELDRPVIDGKADDQSG